MFGHRYFHQLDGKVYFKRSSHGPYYQIELAEDIALRELVAWQRGRMMLVIVLFAAAFIIAVVAFSALLDLDIGFGLAAAFFLVILGVSPFSLMLLIHLKFQNKVREVLGQRQGEQEIDLGGRATPLPSERGREGRLAVLFFIGVVWLTLAAYMLVFSREELPVRMIVIWLLNLGTGGLLTFLGFYGLITLDRKSLMPPPKSSNKS